MSKNTYQPIANKPPKGSVLLCETKAKPKVQAILAKVAAFFRQRGHIVQTLPYSAFAGT